jgi:hypothetical protein
MLARDDAAFDLAQRLREGRATILEIYSFISGLYFRGKAAYAHTFGAAPGDIASVRVIVPGFGLTSTGWLLDRDRLREIAAIPVDHEEAGFIAPLLRDATSLNADAGPECRFILLGSIASEKYTLPLLRIFGERLLFPSEFVGRGDMSRGGLMLRSAAAGEELTYVPVQGAQLRGMRPAKLDPRTCPPRHILPKL